MAKRKSIDGQAETQEAIARKDEIKLQALEKERERIKAEIQAGWTVHEEKRRRAIKPQPVEMHHATGPEQGLELERDSFL